MHIALRGLNRNGQFVPLSAMVMLTTVVFLAATVNVYKVARAKLKVQNLADAVALNVASQIASSMNKVSDLNEWMNHMMAPPPGAAPSIPGSVPNCSNINPDLPPISCAENPNKSSNLNIFSMKGNAAAYAGLVQTVNRTQDLFINAYNNFIGAGTGSSGGIGSNSSLQSILLGDIPELGEPGTTVYVWNSSSGQMLAESAVNAAASGGGGATATTFNTTGMRPLKFTTRDIKVTYKNVENVFGTHTIASRTLGELLAGHLPTNDSERIGWKEPVLDATAPQINAKQGGTKIRPGAGAVVMRTVQVPILGPVVVKAKAQAYVVQGSGKTGEMVMDGTGVQRPVFKPTYWVKLAGS